MKKIDKIKIYLKKNPLADGKRIALKFNLEIKEASLIIKQLSANPVENSINKIEENKFKIFFRNLKTKIDTILSPFFASEAIYILIFILAATLRIVYILKLSKNPELSLPILDAQYYLDWAKRILEEGAMGKTIFFTEPFYAYLLAFFLKFSSQGVKLLIAFQLILGSILPIIVAKIGQKIFTRSIGIIAGLITAVYGPFIFYEGLLLKTSLETFFLALFVLTLLKMFENVSYGRFFLTGIFLGFLAIIKGNALILLPLVILFIFLAFKQERKRAAILSLLFTIGTLCAIFPITLRNYIVEKDFVLTNYSFGIVIYQGNWWNGDGSTALVPPFFRPHPKFEELDSRKMAEAFAGKELKPSQISSFWISKSIIEIFSDPGHAIRSTLMKIALLFNWHELSDDYSYSFFGNYISLLKFLPGFLLISPFAICGIILLIFSKELTRKLALATKKTELEVKRGIVRLLAISGSYLLVLLLSNVNSRYRIPIIPMLILFGSVTVWYFWQKIILHSFKKVFGIGLILAIGLVISLLPLKIYSAINDANAFFQIGSFYMEQKNYPNAQKYFEKTIDTDKNYAWAYSNLFLIHMLNGNISEAQRYAKELVMLRPDDLSSFKNFELVDKANEKTAASVQKEINSRLNGYRPDSDYDPYAYEASRFLKYGDTAKAEEYLNKSLEKFSNPPSSLLSMASLKRNAKDTDNAKRYLIMAVEQDPYLFPARYNLANIYIDDKNFPQMVLQLKKIYEVAPELGETWYNLAIAYINLKNYSAATPIISAYIERYKDDESRKEKVDKFRKFLLQDKSTLNK